jgi:hypothetical protein
LKLNLNNQIFNLALNFTKLDDYKLGRMLGQGAFGFVREA